MSGALHPGSARIDLADRRVQTPRGIHPLTNFEACIAAASHPDPAADANDDGVE